LTKELEFVEFI